MNWKFWQRSHKDVATMHDYVENDPTLLAARRRVDAAQMQLNAATAIAQRSTRTLEINHFSAMMETAWASRPTSKESR